MVSLGRMRCPECGGYKVKRKGGYAGCWDRIIGIGMIGWGYFNFGEHPRIAIGLVVVGIILLSGKASMYSFECRICGYEWRIGNWNRS